jgi:O-antigen/teichoic acid export membrane protein
VKHRLLSDAAWVTGGQVATAVGTVVGVRLLTQVVPPATFGTVSLALGVAALALNVACTPLTQAAIHYYPSLAAGGLSGELQRSLRRSLQRIGMWVLLAILIGGVIYSAVYSGSPAIVVLIATLLICDGWRSTGLSLANAAREHKRYALWQTADAWGRPLLATAAVLVAGESAALILVAYAVASALLNAAFAFGFPRRRPEPPLSASQSAQGMQLDSRLWDYALPLIPLGFIGWANGLGDRYIIGGLLSVADAGIYAASYGLASRPMLMIGGTIELIVRPLYQSAVSAGDHTRANRLLLLWFAAITTIGLVYVAAIALWRTDIAALLLGPEYRGGAELMPWIGAGYCLLTVSYVFERVCYAHARTRRVLLIQACTATAAVIATTVGTLKWGLIGAAMAIPVYFSVQFMAAVLLAQWTRMQAMQPAGALEAAK